MKVSDVTARVEEIRQIAADNEAAHGMEDDLHRDVLRYIASALASPAHTQALAKEALTTRDIDFCRWCS